MCPSVLATKAGAVEYAPFLVACDPYALSSWPFGILKHWKTGAESSESARTPLDTCSVARREFVSKAGLSSWVPSQASTVGWGPHQKRSNPNLESKTIRGKQTKRKTTTVLSEATEADLTHGPMHGSDAWAQVQGPSAGEAQRSFPQWI